jgi:drug/metabolite transporter (DMT)-like permease
MQLLRNGILLIIISDVFFGLLPVTVRWANLLGYSAFQVSIFRFVIALAGIVVLVSLGGQKIKLVNHRALFWRGFFGGTTVLLYFITLQLTTAAKATLLNYTFSIWANVFNVLIFKRRPPRSFPVAILLAFSGTWLVLGVNWGDFAWGDLSGVLSGMSGGAAILAVKECRRTDNTLTIFGSFSLFGLVLSGIMLALASPLGLPQLGAWKPVDGKGWLLLVVMGLVAIAAQMMFTHAYRYTRLADGALLSLLVPVLAGLFAMLLLGETLAPHFILGTAMIMAGCWLLTRDGDPEGPENQASGATP